MARLTGIYILDRRAYEDIYGEEERDAIAEELFSRADVASLHTPLLPETVGMIRGEHLASMKEGATFINTARGAVVREAEVIAVLARRPDLQAVLDVTDPEPAAPDSPLYTLPNVVLTPHIAGALDGECLRLGRMMVDELGRYLAGEPLQGEVTRRGRAARLKTLQPPFSVPSQEPPTAAGCEHCTLMPG